MHLTHMFRFLTLLYAMAFVALQSAVAVEAQKPAEDEFNSLVKLAPVMVQGKSLAVSIFARSRADRRYSEEFSTEVVKVVYEAVTEDTGRGLLIVGTKGEPHPIFVFQRFQELAKSGKLDPELAARAPELTEMMERWSKVINKEKEDDEDDAEEAPEKRIELDYMKIVTALPLPLHGLGAKLYQVAWEEKFDEAKVVARLSSMKAADLERKELFKNYDWAFYLPPKGVFNKVVDDIIAQALKKEEMGFFTRSLVKGALLVVKPKIRKAIEGMRQGILLIAIVERRTTLPRKQVSALAVAYMEAYFPKDAKNKEALQEQPKETGTEHERAVAAVRAAYERVKAETSTSAEAAGT